MCDAIEICDGRQEMRNLSADQPLRAGDKVYGQLHQPSARLRIPQPRSKIPASTHHKTRVDAFLLLNNSKG